MMFDLQRTDAIIHLLIAGNDYICTSARSDRGTCIVDIPRYGKTVMVLLEYRVLLRE